MNNSVCPQIWSDCMYLAIVYGREEGEGGSGRNARTPSICCHPNFSVQLATGWPRHTYGIQLRHQAVLNLVSPIEQCREEAGLHSQKDVEEVK